MFVVDQSVVSIIQEVTLKRMYGKRRVFYMYDKATHIQDGCIEVRIRLGWVGLD